MRIAFVSDWFSEKMGYAENCLPKAVAALGHEVHLIAANVQPYFNTPGYRETYQPFIGPPVVPTGATSLDGFTLHRRPHALHLGKVFIRGLGRALRALRPDVVQTFELAVPSTYEAALLARPLGYRLFVESHLHASVFRTEGRAVELFGARVLGRLAGRVVERCYAISPDAAEIATGFLGMPAEKVRITSLGVDTQLFQPSPSGDTTARQTLRTRLGLRPDEIVCIYTGRFAVDKGPQLLAEAIERLNAEGRPYRGLFVGSGTTDEISALVARRGCVVHPFVPARELPPLYRAAEIGVWPRQESTSQLDAAASGLPIVISDRVTVRERAEGNGRFYREGDVEDLSAQLVALGDPQLRKTLGERGTTKMRTEYSWLTLAEARIADFAAAARLR
jgi:glycosyltransferase involved in cell wall biosynthesis